MALLGAALVAPASHATPSGSNGLIAFRTTVDGNNDISVVRPDGSGLRAVLTTASSESRPTWSPDGRILAFQANYDGDFDVWGRWADGTLRRLIGGPARDGANETQPAWSPDGSRIAYTTNELGTYEVFVARVDGTEEPVNVSRSPGNDRAPAWSPIGDRVAFGSDRAGTYDIWTAAADGGDPVNVTSSPSSDLQPDWSPDGERIAFMSDADGSTSIWTVGADGGDLANLTTDDRSESSPVWAPDGTAIAFELAARGTRQGIWLMDADGGDPRPLIHVGDDARPDWQSLAARGDTSAPTTSISLPEDEGTLHPLDIGAIRGWARDESSVARVEAALRAEMEDGSCRWWTGEEFAAGGCEEHRWAAVTGTTEWELRLGVELPSAGSGSGFRSFTAFSRGVDGLWNTEAMPGAGTAFRVSLEAGRLPVATANGAIAFWSDRGGDRSVYLMDAVGSSVAELTDAGTDESFPAWSPDGRRIAFQSDRAGSWDIYVMDATGRSVRVTPDDRANETQPAWSPDGTRITYASNAPGNWDVFVTDAAGGSMATNLTNHPSVDRGATWSPHGDRIAFTSNRSGDYDVYTIEPDGTGLRQLTDEPTTDSHPAWSPGGTFLMFDSSRSGRREMWRMGANGGTAQRITTTSTLDEYGASVAPDGRHAAFEGWRDDNWDIYIMDPDGQGVTRLTRTSGIDQRPAWQPLPPSSPDREAPRTRIRVPRDGAIVDASELTSVRVAARDATGQVARVQVSLRATAGDGTCAWWTGDGFSPGGCRRHMWLDARRTSDVRWVLRLRTPLPPTGRGAPFRRYVAFARAIDPWWNVETSFVFGSNRARFRVVSEEGAG